jgi:hypothetical protein
MMKIGRKMRNYTMPYKVRQSAARLELLIVYDILLAVNRQ